MICLPCREHRHPQCPEITRQMDATVPDRDRKASPWCDCQHQVPAPTTPEAP